MSLNLSTYTPPSNYSAAPPFASGHTRAQVAVFLLAATIFLDAAGIISSLMQYELLSRAGSGGVTQDEAVWNDLRQGLIALPRLLITIPTVVAFCLWIHRAYRNLAALRAPNLQFTPGWAVGWFFIPFANLVMPYRVTSELWQKSDPETDFSDPSYWPSESAPPRLKLWWAAWIISGIVGQVAMRISFDSPTIEQLMMTTIAGICAGVASITAAIFAIFVVRGIDRRQEERSQRFAAPPLAPPPPPIFTTEAQTAPTAAASLPED